VHVPQKDKTAAHTPHKGKAANLMHKGNAAEQSIFEGVNWNNREQVWLATIWCRCVLKKSRVVVCVLDLCVCAVHVQKMEQQGSSVWVPSIWCRCVLKKSRVVVCVLDLCVCSAHANMEQQRPSVWVASIWCRCVLQQGRGVRVGCVCVCVCVCQSGGVGV
jgi:hypothetical protein